MVRISLGAERAGWAETIQPANADANILALPPLRADEPPRIAGSLADGKEIRIQFDGTAGDGAGLRCRRWVNCETSQRRIDLDAVPSKVTEWLRAPRHGSSPGRTLRDMTVGGVIGNRTDAGVVWVAEKLWPELEPFAKAITEVIERTGGLTLL